MLNLGIIGLSSGNGHPYSWAAIFNGYDKEKMADCPFPAIPEYLAEEDLDTMGIEGARITHIWTQEGQISEHVAAASLIGNIVDDMADLIGEVDAVILARDDGENHLKMAAPFIEAGVPIFIDKPLTDNAEDLREFVRYYEAGKPIMSCSSMRYDEGLLAAREGLGRIRAAHTITCKYWRTYGIHLIEGICAVMGMGVESVQNVGRENEAIVHLEYLDGRHAVLQVFRDIALPGHTIFYGEEATKVVESAGAYSSFRNMLVAFVEMLKTGQSPIDWHDTIELAKIVVAGTLSLEENNRKVYLAEID